MGENGATRGRFNRALFQRLITRRRFVTAAGAASAGVALRDHLGWVAGETADITSPVVHTLMARLGFTAAANRTGTITVVRREDMLRLTVDLYNLVVDGTNANQFVKENKRASSYLVVNFPAQHLAEEALLRTDGGTDEFFETDKLARARLAGPTKLAFQVPESALPLARNVEGLLNWSKWEPRVVPNALPANTRSKGGALVAPASGNAREVAHTAIELPWRLLLSTLPNAGWIHSTAPNAADPVHELWHTRLGERGQLGAGTYVFEPTDRPTAIRGGVEHRPRPSADRAGAVER